MSFISNAFASISIITIVTYMVIEGLVVITAPLWFSKLTLSVASSGPAKVVSVAVTVTLITYGALWFFGGMWTVIAAATYSYIFCNRILKAGGIAALLDVRAVEAFFEQKYAK